MLAALKLLLKRRKNVDVLVKAEFGDNIFLLLVYMSPHYGTICSICFRLFL